MHARWPCVDVRESERASEEREREGAREALAG